MPAVQLEALSFDDLEETRPETPSGVRAKRRATPVPAAAPEDDVPTAKAVNWADEADQLRTRLLAAPLRAAQRRVRADILASELEALRTTFRRWATIPTSQAERFAAITEFLNLQRQTLSLLTGDR